MDFARNILAYAIGWLLYNCVRIVPWLIVPRGSQIRTQPSVTWVLRTCVIALADPPYNCRSRPLTQQAVCGKINQQHRSSKWVTFYVAETPWIDSWKSHLCRTSEWEAWANLTNEKPSMLLQTSRYGKKLIAYFLWCETDRIENNASNSSLQRERLYRGVT
jgi:hypothetical protein